MMSEGFSHVMEATWPPARAWRDGPFILRNGEGGGKRVSAASCEDECGTQDLNRLEASMTEPLVLIRAGEKRLDQALAERGWRVVDPVLAYAAPVASLVAELPPLSAFAHWPPLEIAVSIWQEGGIGPARIKVMQRVSGAKCAMLARSGDRPAGAAFVALHGDQAMLHALEVRPQLRRQGTGETLIRSAANWAVDQGALQLSLVVTERNAAARALYDRLGMRVVGRYHYRMK